MNKLKNVLYYVTAAINTIAGASALLKPAGEFIKNIFSEYSLSDGTISVLAVTARTGAAGSPSSMLGTFLA